MSYTEEEWIEKINALKTESDHYKAQAEKYRAALGAIMKKLVYDDEEEVRMWIKDIPCDVQMDYIEAYQIAKQALEGEEE